MLLANGASRTDGVAAFWDVLSLGMREEPTAGVISVFTGPLHLLVDGGAQMSLVQLVIPDRSGSLASHAGMSHVRILLLNLSRVSHSLI